jgi:outer membrane protein OmpA-like peptidoglycan-associated protein
MKKILSMPVFGVAVLMMLTSCVAKKKYTEAQNTITQLQTENAQLKEQGTTMQQNVATLEARTRSMQSTIDSTNTWVTGQQGRWSSFQAFYDEGVKTTEQVHQQLHTEMDALIGAENITTANGRVMVNLKENILFTSGSSRLSTKGNEVLTRLAQIVSSNPNVEIDIASAPGYYGDGTSTTSTANSSMNMNNSSSMNNNATTNNQNTTMDQSTTNTTATDTKMKTDADGDMKLKSGDTKIKADADGDVKVKTSTTKVKTNSGSARSSYSGAAKTSTAKKSTASRYRSESSAKSKTYKSSPAKKTSASATWSLNMSRSSSIAKKLVDEGVSKSRILVTNGDNAAGAKKDFQIVISPKSDTYYNTIGNGNGGTTPSNQ